MARYRREQQRQRTQIRHYLEYFLLRAIVFVIARIPMSAALWVGRRLADLTFDVLRKRRTVTLENLRAALGDPYSAAELQGIARGAYRNIGMTMVELGRFSRESPADLLDRTRIAPRDPIHAAVARGRGIVYLTGHTGNWELCGICVNAVGGPLAAAVGDQKNLLVDRYFKALRGRMGVEQISITSGLRQVLRRLHEGGRVALAADQDAGRDGVFIDFFGRPASTAAGPARFAYRTGAAIVIGFDRLTGQGRHEIRLYPPIVPDTDRPEEEEVRRMLGEYARHLEDFIREYPEQWLWMHRRWKSAPPVARGE